MISGRHGWSGIVRGASGCSGSGVVKGGQGVVNSGHRQVGASRLNVWVQHGLWWSWLVAGMHVVDMVCGCMVTMQLLTFLSTIPT